MGNSMEYAGIRRQFHPNLEDYSQDFVAFTIYSNSKKILGLYKELQSWDSISKSSVANDFLQFKDC